MTIRRRLYGYELRCVLTLHLFQHGKATVADLIDMLDFHGFEVAGRTSKTVSDALRYEIAHGRVRRSKRDQYGPASMPRATEYRIHQRALALREEAAALQAKSDDAFWDALFGLELGDDPHRARCRHVCVRLATDQPRRVAVLSVHTSPLAQPGTGDAGGMNVYVLQSALQMARRGVEVEIFTRATSSADQPTVQVAPGVLVRNVVAGPFEGLDKYDLPTQLCAFTAGVLRAEATHEPGYYDVVHSHYWLSGQVGWLARDRWGVPLVHTAHTLAAVKNASLANGDAPEPPLRAIGEQQVVDEADRLIVNTEHEAQQLISLHHADPDRIDVVHPGVDLETFTPGDQRAARSALGIPDTDRVVAFVGRIQPLKAPDVLLQAVAKLPDVRVLVAGGPSGSGLAAPDGLVRLADELGIADRVTFLPPQTRDELVNVYRAADMVAVPSYSESFGLVAIEAQACGTPVVAAAVGGLPVAVRDGVSGTLVDGHDPGEWAQAIAGLFERGPATMRAAAVEHAATFSWAHTVDGLLASYGHAIRDYRARHQPHDVSTRRTGRRFSMRRGVRA